MKTSIYNIWSKLVTDFVATISKDSDLHKEIDTWLDDGGNKKFQAGQGQYFKTCMTNYIEAPHPHSKEIFDFSKQQIAAGFTAWFAELLHQFPLLNNEEVKKEYQLFITQCMDDKYDPFISSRAVLTWQWAKRGNFQDIFFVIEGYQLLEEASHASVLSMEEHVKKAPPTPSIHNNPSSPTFLRKPKQVEEIKENPEQLKTTMQNT